ncbi:MAG: hypothetical protein RLZZ398_369 [Verrucomicrobiota bacterium]|jgi:hypothetical protein
MNIRTLPALSIVTLLVVLCSCAGPGAISTKASGYVAFDAWRTSSRITPYAARGSARAIHDLFIATYTRASDPYLGGEDLEIMCSNLGEVAESIGDKRFAEALGRERSEVIHSVRAIGGVCLLDSYPETQALMSRTPKVKLPLEFSREDIHTPLMKALIKEEG